MLYFSLFAGPILKTAVKLVCVLSLFVYDFRVSMYPDLDKTMQRFLRKPVRVTLATLLGVYRAVMRLSSIARALEDTFGVSSQAGAEAESGPVLLRKRIVAPLQQVSGRLSSVRRFTRRIVLWMGLSLRV